MDYHTILDERDPFVQVLFRSVVAALVLTFVAAVGLELHTTGLVRVLFVPIGAAFFCGILAALVEFGKRRYLVGIVLFVGAVALFPGLALLILSLLRIPHDTTEAQFMALVPQAVAAPAFFAFVRKRFYGGMASTS